MSKVVNSPVKRFPGSVTLPDSLTYPQMIEFERAMVRVKGAEGNAEQWYLLLAGIIPVVQQWRLTGVPEAPTPDVFPATPRKSATKLASWLLEEVMRLAREDDDPNE